MSILKIFEYPSPELFEKAAEIKTITPEIKELAQNMLDTMYEAQGIGLAANQIGILQRIIVVDLQQEDFEPLVLINPVIVKQSNETHTIEEGCLSIMPVKADVTRPQYITVEYIDLDGNNQSVDASDLFSSCLQHEIDHLNGVLFVDRLSKLKRTLTINKFKKLKREEAKEVKK